MKQTYHYNNEIIQIIGQPNFVFILKNNKTTSVLHQKKWVPIRELKKHNNTYIYELHIRI